MPKFVLTGATGGLGSAVLKHLLQRVPASDIIISLYNPSGASPSLTTSGVSIRHGDYADPASLTAAFAGADRLLLVSHPAMEHESRVAHHKAAIDAARRAGVRRIYYTSLAFAAGSDALVMRAHRDTERYLRESGVGYTVTREGVYCESWRVYFGLWDPEGGVDQVLVPHGDGPVAWASRDDLGEATAKIMVEDGYENETLLLTGPRSSTLTDLAALLSRLLGRTITLVVGSEDEFVQANAGKPGLFGDEGFLRKWATTYPALARGELDLVDPLLRTVLGREPRSLEDVVRSSLGLPAGSC